MYEEKFNIDYLEQKSSESNRIQKEDTLIVFWKKMYYILIKVYSTIKEMHCYFVHSFDIIDVFWTEKMISNAESSTNILINVTFNQGGQFFLWRSQTWHHILLPEALNRTK